MSVIVFVGPTLSALDPRTLLAATYLPPAGQGDVLRAALTPGTRVIGIIDGYYERIPSPWHKEILWAMARGIHVFGSASLGALRAAELHSFGMEGVGEIYEAFADGSLTDDDEVALLHGPGEHRYRPASEAMVNVRVTLAAAEAAQVISAATRNLVVAAAKTLFYPDRVYPRILADARAQGGDGTQLEALARFLVHGRIDQKRDDAREMLAVIQQRLAAGLAPKQVAYDFVQSENFHRMLSAATQPEPSP